MPARKRCKTEGSVPDSMPNRIASFDTLPLVPAHSWSSTVDFQTGSYDIKHQVNLDKVVVMDSSTSNSTLSDGNRPLVIDIPTQSCSVSAKYQRPEGYTYLVVGLSLQECIYSIYRRVILAIY